VKNRHPQLKRKTALKWGGRSWDRREKKTNDKKTTQKREVAKHSGEQNPVTEQNMGQDRG